jgi:hypothetical protein
MGARGKGAGVHARAVHKNRRPNAKARAAAVASGDVVEYSAGYWDLLCGQYLADEVGRARVWPSDRNPGRRRAWTEWRERIRQRWPFAWSCGHRPDGWWDFDLPHLLPQLEALADAELAAMSREEIVYHVDADAEERTAIEREWDKAIETSRCGAVDESAWRRRAVATWDVPGWFFDQRRR